MRPFRLLVMSDAAAPGGAEMTLAHVLGGLPAEIDVWVMGIDDAVLDLLTAQRPGAARVLVDDIADRSDLASMRALRRRLVEISPDLIQFNLSMMSSLQWQMLVAHTVRGPKTIAVENSPLATYSNLSNRLKKVTSRFLDAHVAVGEATARMIEDTAGLPTGSVDTIYHGVPDTNPPEGGVGPTTSDRVVIGTIARHDPVKGLDVLLDALATVDDVQAVLIGNGEERENLVAQRARLGLDDRVEFREIPWDQRASDQLPGFDIFVLPSRLEGFPVSIMEAMLAGVPVIATDVGSVRESVDDGVTGLIVPPEDPAALAGAIAELATDPERRAAMGDAARAVGVARFSVEATVASYVALYERLLGAVP